MSDRKYLRLFLCGLLLIILSGTNVVAQRTTLKVDYIKGFDPQTQGLLTIALRKLDSVINTNTFKQRVLSADFSRKRGFTNEEIYNLIIGGKEMWLPNGETSTEDRIWNLKLELYDDYAGGDEVGVTTGDGVTHTYKEYVKKNGAACYAAHLAHEYCHKLGFTHPRWHIFGSVKKRSVPYVVGDIVAELLQANCP